MRCGIVLRNDNAFPKIAELDPRQISNGPFSETEKGFGAGPTPGSSHCTSVSPLFRGLNGVWKFLEEVQIMTLGMISS